MIQQRELPCGCEEIERNGERSILYTCQQHGGGPLSFGRLAASMSQASRAGTEATRRVGMIPELAVQVPTLTETVTQRVTIDPEELKLLCTLVQCERVTLLNERRAYVLARRGDTTRFQELIRQIDGKLFSVTRLGDKLSALTAGESDDQRSLNG